MFKIFSRLCASTAQGLQIKFDMSELRGALKLKGKIDGENESNENDNAVNTINKTNVQPIEPACKPRPRPRTMGASMLGELNAALKAQGRVQTPERADTVSDIPTKLQHQSLGRATLGKGSKRRPASKRRSMNFAALQKVE